MTQEDTENGSSGVSASDQGAELEAALAGGWFTQIGPDVAGPLSGMIGIGNGASFIALPSTNFGSVYAQYSTDAGNSWQNIPSYQSVQVFPGANAIQWRLDPQGAPIKFIMAPLS